MDFPLPLPGFRLQVCRHLAVPVHTHHSSLFFVRCFLALWLYVDLLVRTLTFAWAILRADAYYRTI